MKVGEEDVMSYAVVVYDLLGNRADCVVAGEDPVGLQAGDHVPINAPTFDLTDCTVGVLAE